MRAIKGKQGLLLSTACALVSQAAYGLEPAPLYLGGFEVAPTLSLSQRYLDNVLLQPEDTIESGVLVVRPELKAALVTDRAQLLFDVNYEAGRYSYSSADDYDDVTGALGVEWTFNSRNQITIGTQIESVHEARGTGYSEGAGALALETPNTFRNVLHGFKYRFGAPRAKGRLVFNAGAYSREATSSQALLARREYNQSRFGGAFYWRVGGRTDALIEVRHSDVQYDLVTGADSASNPLVFDSLDSVAAKYFVGISWDATGKTEGSVRIGQATKYFESPQRKDFTGFSWEVAAKWSPKTYSTFSWNTAREQRETNGLGSFIDARTVEMDWQHDWSDRIRSKLFYSFESEKYVDSSDGRKESVTNLGVRMNYVLRRWFEIGFSASLSNKDANIESFNYDSNLAALYFKWGL